MVRAAHNAFGDGSKRRTSRNAALVPSVHWISDSETKIGKQISPPFLLPTP